MQKTELVVFDRKDILDVISDFGIRIKEADGKQFLADQDGNIRCCDNCKRKLETSKVGSIAHGSTLIFCDNPLCLSAWVADNKI
jgi:hypothetical protein